MVKINSSPITFIDATDSRKFEVHINSNLQQVQVYNKNNSTYSPDWSNTPLTMRASVYLDSADITANTNVTFTWYKNEISTAAKIGSGKDLIIKTNVLATEPVITYICQATYQNLTASSRMDYARIDSGLDGVVGNSAPAVQARYSVDGLTSWTLTLNAATHKYVQYSYDGGITWTTAIKMAGEDGKSVAILGTAYTPDDLTVGEVVRLYSNSSNTTAINTNGLSTGDSYLVSGYLCVYNADNNSFICTGKIQGPAGNDGQSSYVFIRYATDANGTSMSTSPSGKTHIGIYTSNTNVAPTTAGSYTWSKFIGDNAKSIILSGDSQVFKVSKTSAYTPTTIKVVAQTINTSVTAWTYSVNGGQTFSSTAPTGVVQNGNIVTITGSTLTSNSVVIKASDGTIEDVFTVYKAFDGTDGSQGAPGQSSSMAFLTNENVTFGANAQGQITGTAITTNVVAYTGTTKSTPTIGTISGLPTGMTATIGTAVNNEIPITLTISNNATLGSTSSNNGSITIPVNGPVYTNLILSWSKVNSGVKGADGVGINSVTITYGSSTSASTQPTSWQPTIPAVAEGSYLWTRTVTDYTDANMADTVTLTYAKQGAKGETGSPGTPVTVSSIKYQAGTSSTTAPTGTWYDYVVAASEGSYLWTKTTFSDGKVAYGVAKQGVSGRGVSSVTEYYLATTASSGVSTTTNGWTTSIQSLTATNKYLWNYELITYTDNTTSTTAPVIIGVFGNTGAAGKGIKSVTEYYLATASSSGVTTSTSGWTTTIQTLTSTNKYLWNYELITYTDNTTTTIDPIIIGVYGDKGANGTNASLVDITPSALYFKSTTGKDGTFTPDYIYLYPRFQTVTYSKWEYSTNGGASWTTVTSGSNGLTIGTYNSVASSLQISRSSALYTDTITSISFRCVSSNASVYDTVSIAKIYDVVDLQIGGRNLVLNSNKSISSIEYLVRSYEMSEDWILGTTYTITIKGTVNSGQAFGIWANGSATRVATLTYDSKTGLHKAIFTPTTISTQVEKTLRVYNTASATATNATIEWIKLEKGNKATDWTPAPEDIDANIATVNTTLTNSIADVKTTTNSIASRVSATETSITTINGNVSSLTTKVSAAEQKITPTAIVSTVRSSTDYTNDLSQKVGTTEIISKINQTAESVTISASKIGLLGSTNIPDLTADKIKGGTLTLGGSNAATQNGQLVVKNASNADMIKLSKNGVVVKAGHLAVASDFTNQVYNFSTDTWTTTTNTSQLDLSDKYVRMGVYSSSGYANNMKLTNSSLSFRGSSQGYGDWGSFIGHDEYYDFVIQDSVRGYIVFRGQGDTELAMIDGAGIVSSGLYSNTISSSSNMHIDSSGRMYRSTSSSKRYKTDIQDITTEYLKPEKLYDLPVREFKYKEGYLSKEDPRIDTFVPGFISEEVNEVYPIACEYDGDKPENWNIRFIVPAMLKLIQDQKKEIDALKELVGNKEVSE